MQKVLVPVLICCTAIVLALAAIFISRLPVAPAAAAAPRLELFAPASVYIYNRPIQVYVRTVDPGALSAFEFTLQLDSTLAAVSAIQALSPLGISGACDPSSLTCAVALGPKQLADGTHLAIYTYGAAHPITSDQTIAVITLQPAGKTGALTLHLSSPLITNAAGQAVIPLSGDVVIQLADRVTTYLPLVRKLLP
jgi:hypothetical protein